VKGPTDVLAIGRKVERVISQNSRDRNPRTFGNCRFSIRDANSKPRLRKRVISYWQQQKRNSIAPSRQKATVLTPQIAPWLPNYVGNHQFSCGSLPAAQRVRCKTGADPRAMCEHRNRVDRLMSEGQSTTPQYFCSRIEAPVPLTKKGGSITQLPAHGRRQSSTNGTRLQEIGRPRLRLQSRKIHTFSSDRRYSRTSQPGRRVSYPLGPPF
jgi:hypothetical protein